MLTFVLCLFVIIEVRVTIARPKFESTMHLTANKVKTFNSSTGLPIHSDVFRQTINITDSDTKRLKSFSDNIRRMQLNSDARLHSNACIALDPIESLESVQCLYGRQQFLLLTFKSSADANLIYKQWIKSDAKFINGGPEWGCRNVTTQELIVIFQKISTFRLTDTKIVIETFKDTNISPFLCFADISMNLTWEQASVTTKPSSTPTSTSKTTVPAANSRSLFDSWSFDAQQPRSDEIFYPGQNVDVSWLYSNIDGTTSLTIVLCRKQILIDAEISTVNTKINSVLSSFTIPANLEISSNDQYYFSFRFSRSLIPYKRTSALFYIPTQAFIAPRTPPSANEVFYPGDIVPLSWQSVNFAVTTQIIIRFCRARSIIPDSTLATFTVLATTDAYNYTISSTLDRADNDKYYYFEFDYCKSWLSLNCKKTTNNFFVPSRPYLHPTFPDIGDWFSPLQTLTLKWASANFASTNDLLTIKLRRYNFLLPDSDVDTFTCTVSSSGSCTRTLPAVDKSLSDYYFEFNWCKNWYSTDCTTKSNRFSIPAHTIGSWNYDVQRGQALASKTVYLSSCSSLCPTHDATLFYLCLICNQGRSMSMLVNCTNCWAAYDYSIVQMDLVHNGNSPSLDKITVRMNSRVSVNVDFTVRADYQRSFDGWLPLPAIPIGPSIIIAIGSIKVGVGLSFSPSISWNITVDTMGNLTAGVDYTWQTNLTLVNTPGNTSKEYTQSLMRNIHPVQGDFQANLLVNFTYQPELELTVGIFTVSLGTNVYIIFESVWHYPPFAALSTSIFDWNSQKNASIHLSFPSNSCLTNHFSRYHTMYGLRGTQISIGFDQVSTLVSVFTDFQLSWSSQSLLDLGPYELSSGCMFQACLNTDAPRTIYLVLNRPFNEFNDTPDIYLSRAVVNDLAYALDVSLTRIFYNSTFGVQQDQMTGMVIVFLPSVSSLSDNPNVDLLVQRFQNQISNTKSLLYSGLVTNSLNFTQTLNMNNFRALQR
ncbi:unnamed protein product [Rotaria socialis]|uniref:Uncharacterized protein n=2 Tax=Rotaria socialis TaxID=392032 RepID=A0A821JUM4_9BILA|nr:unnamed protein product [Rotaria socialis]CAF4720626.1 unnamed protein product [Rotaria socialis]